MYILTIICSTCNQPALCEAFVCEAVFPGIHECMKRKGRFLISEKIYAEKKPQINKMIQSCPTGSIVLTGPSNGETGPAED